MPSHVTLLYPFVDDGVLAAEVIRELRDVLGDFSPFAYVLAELAAFPPSATTAPVLFLAPEPSHQFREMTSSLVRAFPDFPPYGGRHASVTPHLTIAAVHGAPLADIRDRVALALPISARATEARLMGYGDGGWRTTSRLYLGRNHRGHVEEPLFL
jgi:2'-5' RNA ligase